MVLCRLTAVHDRCPNGGPSALAVLLRLGVSACFRLGHNLRSVLESAGPSHVFHAVSTKSNGTGKGSDCRHSLAAVWPADSKPPARLTVPANGRTRTARHAAASESTAAARICTDPYWPRAPGRKTRHPSRAVPRRPRLSESTHPSSQPAHTRRGFVASGSAASDSTLAAPTAAPTSGSEEGEPRVRDDLRLL